MRPPSLFKTLFRAFTLIETVLAVALLGLLAGALYAVTHAALEAAKTSMDDQIWYERTDAFLRATRKAFLTMPGRARLGLRYETGGGAATPEIVFADAGSYFGMTAAGGTGADPRGVRLRRRERPPANS